MNRALPLRFLRFAFTALLFIAAHFVAAQTAPPESSSRVTLDAVSDFAPLPNGITAPSFRAVRV